MSSKLLLTLLIIILGTQRNYAQCPNGNAEQGTFNLWGTAVGFHSTAINGFTPLTPANRFAVIQNTGTWTDITLVNNIDAAGNFQVPKEGTYAFRLGNNAPTGKSEIMWYKFKVTPSNVLFKFRFAVVFTDGGHAPIDQPFFNFFMNITSNNNKPHLPPVSPITVSETKDVQLFNQTSTKVIADVQNPFFKSNLKTGEIFKGWQCKEFDLTKFLGDSVLICFQTADCSQTGHFGYAYIDGLCDNFPVKAAFSLNTNQFCSSNNSGLTMDAGATIYEDRYTIEITESNDALGTSLNTANTITNTIFGEQAGIVDLKKWYTLHN